MINWIRRLIGGENKKPIKYKLYSTPLTDIPDTPKIEKRYNGRGYYDNIPLNNWVSLESAIPTTYISGIDIYDSNSGNGSSSGFSEGFGGGDYSGAGAGGSWDSSSSSSYDSGSSYDSSSSSDYSSSSID